MAIFGDASLIISIAASEVNLEAGLAGTKSERSEQFSFSLVPSLQIDLRGRN